MKIRQFIWERLRSPFVSGNGHVEYPKTFHEELNNQCGRIIFIAALIATFAWLPYIPIDRQLHPGEPLIVALRIGLSLVGLTVLVLRGLKRFHRYNLLLLIILSAYLEIATGLITGLTKADPSYLGGYFLVLTLLALVPIPRRTALSILAVSLLIFFTSGFAHGMHFDSARLRYSLNDIMVTVVVVAFFIYLLDGLRLNSWEKSRKIEQQNETLRQSEEKFRLIVNTIPHIVSICDMNLRCSYISPSIQGMLGYTPEELMALTPDQLITPESMEIAMKAYQEDQELEQSPDFSGHNVRILELDLRHKNGTVIPFENTIKFLRDAKGVPVGIIILAMDISERKRAENALRQSEKQYRILADNSDDVIWTADAGLRFTYISPSVMKMRGMTVEEAMNEKLEELMTPASLNTILGEYSRYLPEIEHGKNPSVRMDLEEYRKDGSTVWVEASMRPMRDTDGHLIGYIGVTRDISERKKAEEALHESESKYRFLIENSNDIFWTYDLKKMAYSFCSNSIEPILGYSSEESVGMTLDDIFSPETKKSVVTAFGKMFGRNATTDRVLIEAEHIARDGHKVWMELNAVVQKDKTGKAVSMNGISRDISERKRVEEIQRVSEEKFRQIVENASDSIYRLSSTGAFTFINPAGEMLLGYSLDDIQNHYFWEIIPESHKKEVISFYADMSQRQVRQSYNEFPIILKSGAIMWVGQNVRREETKEGGVEFLGIARDITDRKKAEDALQASEEKYRQIIESASDCIFRLSSTGAFTFINPAMELLVGYSLDDIQNHYFWEIIPDSHKKDVISFYADMSQRQVKETYYEFPCILKSGAIMWFSQSIRREETAEGGVEFLGIGRDITDRKKAEDALQASEEKFRQIVSSIPYAVVMLDMNLRFTYMSAGIQRILGYTPEEAIALSLDQIFTPESLAILYKSFQERLEANAKGSDPNYILILELEQYHKNGSTVFLGNTMTFLRNTSGSPVGILSVSADITERKQAEAKLKEAKEAAEAANRSKSLFLANMSHEIRTPMNAILGFTQLMQRDTSLTPQSRDHLEIINRSGEHLLATINDILEMSKIEAGRTVFVPTTFDLHALIHDLERMFRLRTDSKNLRFLVEKVGQVPRWVKTDEGKLRQVLINLLGNAVKFTDEGGIVLRICGKVENADTVYLKFEVEDTGPGMGDDEIGRLFQAFEQTRSGLNSGGTGLGLALSRGFMEIMGGTISVSSTLGKGSIFRVNIPIQEDREENAAKKESKQGVQCLKPGQDEIRILIVDDRETNRKLLLQLLSSVGFSTNHAVDGKEAISMVSKWKPHLVLMDMAMPVMDGYEATRKIKASADIKNTAIVAVTASAFEEDKQRILAAGADGYLSKPFKDTELFETIGQLTGAKYLYEETGAPKVSETADDKVLMRKTIAALPPELVNQMRAAVESADLDLLNELALQLATEQPLLAKQIQEMAARYEYEALTELFSSEDKP